VDADRRAAGERQDDVLEDHQEPEGREDLHHGLVLERLDDETLDQRP
jgi:hypothetical protein